MIRAGLRWLAGLWRRHRLSLPLAVLSLFFFIPLARELAEGELDPVDRAVANVVGAWQGGPPDRAMVALTRLGGEVVMTAVGLAALVLLLALRRGREACFFALVAGGAVLLNVALKLAFHRPRPDEALRYLVTTTTLSSFPSGHAMSSTGVLASLLVAAHATGAPRWALALGWLAAAAAVAGIDLSRVYLGAHYPSDVAAGVLRAAAWVSLLAGWFYPTLVPGEGEG